MKILIKSVICKLTGTKINLPAPRLWKPKPNILFCDCRDTCRMLQPERVFRKKIVEL